VRKLSGHFESICEFHRFTARLPQSYPVCAVFAVAAGTLPGQPAGFPQFVVNDSGNPFNFNECERVCLPLADKVVVDRGVRCGTVPWIG